MPKKRINVGDFIKETDWTISKKFTKEKTLAIIYAGDTYIKSPSHPTCQFMSHLSDLIMENEIWAENAEICNYKWNHFHPVLKAMWRKYQAPKNDRHKYDKMYTVAKTVFNYYKDKT